MIFQNLCYVTHTKLPSKTLRLLAITKILWYNSIIGNEQKEQFNLDFQGGNKHILLTLYRALSDVDIYRRIVMSPKLMRLPEVVELCGVCGRTIYRKVDKGIFPSPVILSKDVNGKSTANRWRTQEVLDWIGGLSYA